MFNFTSLSICLLFIVLLSGTCEDVGADAVIIILGEQRSHRDNVLRIVVFDGPKISKFPLSGCIVGYDVRSLDVNAFASRLGTYKVDFSSL